MSFENVYGQDKQITILKRAVKTGRVAHAYLFHGIKGIGKRTSAEAFAQALNCKKGGVDPCNECPSCVKINRGFHPDVITLKPEGAFVKIQAIRDLQEHTKFRPSEGRKRVFIIVDADRMNSPSANALLKTLEEPNPNNVIILITARPYLLPATIISRCQRIRYDPIRKDIIRSFLVTRESLSRETAQVIASSSHGSIGKALDMMGESSLTFKIDVIEQIAAYDSTREPLAFFAVLDALGRGEKNIPENLDVLRDWYRDLLVYKETGESERLIYQDLLQITEQFSKKLSGADILNSIDAVHRASTAIGQNANKQLTLEVMLFKLLKISSIM